jgi:endogenous inhibitor of DNA gyrase (YacG/DUF329 family)
MRSASKLVSCPNCGKAATYSKDNPFRPFCCERCKLIDLGAWAEENYRVAVKGEGDDAVSNETPPES